MKFLPVVVLTLTSLAVAFPGPQLNSGKQKRDCDCKAYSDCSNQCGAFGNTAGSQVSEGLCILSCGGSSGCTGNWACCLDGTACQGDGCCSIQVSTWSYSDTCDGSSVTASQTLGSGYKCFENTGGGAFSVQVPRASCKITTWSGNNCRGSSAVFNGDQGGCTTIPYASVSLDCPLYP